MHCVVCTKKIRQWLHMNSYEVSKDQWVCGYRCWKVLREAVEADLAWVYIPTD